MSVFGELIDQKVLRVLRVLAKKKGNQFHLQKISQEANVPIATVFRIMKMLVKLDLVEQAAIGKFKIYKFAQNKKTKEIGVYLKNA